MPISAGQLAGDPLPPLEDPENADPQSDAWRRIIREKIRERSRRIPLTTTSSQELKAYTIVRDEEVILSGTRPSLWERIGRKDEEDRDFLLWKRVYPSVTFQKYKVLTVTFEIVTYGVQDDVQARQQLPPPLVYWIKQGQPYQRLNQIHYVWEHSSIRKKTLEGKETYIEVAESPRISDAEFPDVPLARGKWGDPKRELAFATAVFDANGVHLALKLRVRDKEGRPVEGATVELDSSATPDGVAELAAYIERPPEAF